MYKELARRPRYPHLVRLEPNTRPFLHYHFLLSIWTTSSRLVSQSPRRHPPPPMPKPRTVCLEVIVSLHKQLASGPIAIPDIIGPLLRSAHHFFFSPLVHVSLSRGILLPTIYASRCPALAYSMSYGGASRF